MFSAAIVATPVAVFMILQSTQREQVSCVQGLVYERRPGAADASAPSE
jgi:hypothetical protein